MYSQYEQNKLKKNSEIKTTQMYQSQQQALCRVFWADMKHVR